MRFRRTFLSFVVLNFYFIFLGGFYSKKCLTKIVLREINVRAENSVVFTLPQYRISEIQFLFLYHNFGMFYPVYYVS